MNNNQYCINCISEKICREWAKNILNINGLNDIAIGKMKNGFDCAHFTSLKMIEDEHPYRVSGKRETFCDYNQGWSDAIDRVDSLVKG